MGLEHCDVCGSVTRFDPQRDKITPTTLLCCVLSWLTESQFSVHAQEDTFMRCRNRSMLSSQFFCGLASKRSSIKILHSGMTAVSSLVSAEFSTSHSPRMLTREQVSGEVPRTHGNTIHVNSTVSVILL